MILPAEGEFRLNGEVDTTRFGARLARVLAPGEAICLSGPLGAGKSVMARGLIRALVPGESDIPSPSYTLAQFYAGGPFPIAHFDLYRLASANEVYELGLDEALRDGAAVIEWAERLGHHLPPNRLDIEFYIDGAAANAPRRIRLMPHGAWEERPLEI